MAHVFISYKREDRDFAFLVKNEIERAGYEVWIDQRLEAGESWIAQIENNIREAFALVLILTPNSQLSKYVTYEWSFALGRDIRVIALLRTPIEPAELHQRLADIQQIDFRHQYDWDGLLFEIKKAKAIYDTGQAKEKSSHSENEEISSDTLLLVENTRSRKPATRLGAVRALGVKGDISAVSYLSKILLDDEELEVQIAAAQALKRLEDARSLPSLAVALLGSKDWRLRLAAIEAIEKLATPAALPILSEVLNDENEDVRLATTAALGLIDDPHVVGLLCSAAKNSTPRVKIAALWNLGTRAKTVPMHYWAEFLEDTSKPEDGEMRVCDVAAVLLEEDVGTDEARQILKDWRTTGSTAAWKLPF